MKSCRFLGDWSHLTAPYGREPLIRSLASDLFAFFDQREPTNGRETGESDARAQISSSAFQSNTRDRVKVPWFFSGRRVQR